MKSFAEHFDQMHRDGTLPDFSGFKIPEIAKNWMDFLPVADPQDMVQVEVRCNANMWLDSIWGCIIPVVIDPSMSDGFIYTLNRHGKVLNAMWIQESRIQ